MLVIVRGGGDIATGTIYKLYKSHFDVLILETEHPSAIRRNVAFSEAVYTGSHQVEDVTCLLAKDIDDAKRLLREGKLAVLVDPEGKCIGELHPDVVVDGILAKVNTGTTMDMAPLTIGLGPGFEAGADVHKVIETRRGHRLGRVIRSGTADPDTGVPGTIAGYSNERVIHSPADGILHNVRNITDTVVRGDVICTVNGMEIRATIDGLLRGLIRDGYPVTKGFKIADIDPRLDEFDNCFTISDKARCIGGGVLQAILEECDIWKK